MFPRNTLTVEEQIFAERANQAPSAVPGALSDQAGRANQAPSADPSALSGQPGRADLAPTAEPGSQADQAERAGLAAYRRARRQERIRRLGTGALGLAVLAGIWQLVAALLHDPVFLPSVSQTAASFAHYFNRPYPAQGKPLWLDALTSLRRILIGFTTGTALGVALGTAMSASRFVRYLVDPVIEVLRPLPPLAFIPLFIIWLGIGADRGDQWPRLPDHAGQ
jgi:hypothetical protein